MTWSNLASISLKTDWQFTEPIEGEFFRFKHSGAPANGAYVIGQAQFNEDGSINICGSRIYTVDILPEILQLNKPAPLSQRRVGVRRLPSPPTIEAQLRNVLRPALFSSSPNSSFPSFRNSWVVEIDVF